ncbi:MAG: enoyl-CoA hydratase/isomerase family protein [Firmicutes bacterium]|nr:enoyl-CoA hydratase/isomerase family protein [Bacillota bacterium]
MERSGNVLLLTLNRPEKKNAFNLAMIDAWAQALVEARTDPSVHVIVETGAGDAFCSGGDVSDMAQRTSDVSQVVQEKNFLFEHIHRIALALEDLDKPVIAAINGPAVGAGMDLAMITDLRLMADTARLSEGYVKVGLVPGDGGAYYLPRLVGISKALELFWTGDFITAEQALQMGIVNHVVPKESLMDETMALANRIAEGPQLAIRMTKRAVYQSYRSDLRTALDLISSHLAVVSSSKDHEEGVRAFLEKRKPHFTGA